MEYNIVIRILVIIFAVLTGYVIYGYIFEPYVLQPMCLVDSNKCVRLSYYNYKNSVLIHMQPTGFWIWFNGYKAFVYGQLVGQICEEPDKYEAAYAINTKTGQKEGYECVMKLDDLISYYKEHSKEKFIYKRVEDPLNFDVYNVLNLFDTDGIINLKM